VITSFGDDEAIRKQLEESGVPAEAIVTLNP
jgi:hypothetical protein